MEIEETTNRWGDTGEDGDEETDEKLKTGRRRTLKMEIGIQIKKYQQRNTGKGGDTEGYRGGKMMG